MLKTVKIPEQFEPIFEKAQEYVSRYFREKKADASKGTIEIFGERYILVRAASMSVDFFETVMNLYKKEDKEEAFNIARQLLFDIAHAIGKQDARNFHKKMNLIEPIEKLSAGPIHFSHSGWAFVDIFPESRPSPDENYYLIYDHPYSFESAAWLESGKKSDFPVCVMNAGYSSGWCEESFGITLVASEIMCIAKGDTACRFIMATPSKIEGYIAEYMKKKPELAKKITKYEVPGFFKRKEIEAKLRESEEKFRVIFNRANDGILLTDIDKKRFYLANDMVCRMLGYNQDEIKSLGIMDIHPEKDLPYILEQFERQTRHEIAMVENIAVKRKDGTVFYADISSSPVTLNGKEFMIGIFRDITERKIFEEKIKRFVLYDIVTELPNRVLFLNNMEAAASYADRQKNYKFAVFVLNLDRFKKIIDSLSHKAGDQLLIEVASRLKKHLRPYDEIARFEYDMVARLSGDEFAILLSDVGNINDVIKVAERLHNKIKLPIEIDNQIVHITASIGITMSEQRYKKPEDILRDAHTAMYKAKMLGKDCYVVFDEIMHAQATSYLQLENSLSQAIEKNEFLLHYQPIVSCKAGNIVGFEALLSWKSPEKGLLFHNEFIPLAEEAGLIIPIGKWMLREACRQIYAWRKQFPSHSQLTMSVNISIKQFTFDLVETINKILNETGLDPSGLKLEITESAIINHPESAADIFLGLKNLNIKVQMDDFGTGYSSLSYLQQFFFDAVKIDRSFIKDMCNNKTVVEIVKTIISMAHNMKMEVIAEGVETIKQLEELRKLNCDYYQGYWFSKPLGWKEAEGLLDNE